MPGQVQLNGESNGLSVENLKLDVDDAQSGGVVAAESVKHLRPQHYTHPSTINNGHIDSLDVFIDDINRALSGALSRDGIIYTKVSVLFLRWEDDVFIDPGHNNGVQSEIDNLERVLTEAYSFETELYLIPSHDSQRSLQREIFQFQEIHASRDELLVVYYGGHGELNRMDQSVWSQGDNGASVDWFSIQHLLEYAVPDVLILLDCCFAASADQRSVDGTVEVLAACGHETETVGISDWSFTNRLTEILRDMKDQCFTVAQLHSKLVNYRAVKGPKRLLRTPHHGIMSNKDKASIRISALKRKSAINAPDDIDVTLSEGSEQSESVASRVLIAVSVQGNLDATSWRDWLLSQLPTGIEALSLLKTEGIFGSHSKLGILSLPVALWDLLPERSAYKFISFVTTPNLVMRIQDHPNLSIEDPAQVDHTAWVQSQFVKPQSVGSLSSSVAQSMDSKEQEHLVMNRGPSKTLSSAHNDTSLRDIDIADNLTPVPALAEIVVKLYTAAIASFEWHTKSYKLPKDLLHINTCFSIEGKRLQLWADLWHLDSLLLSGAPLEYGNSGILKSIELTLHNMLDLFRGIRRMPNPPSGVEASEAPDDLKGSQPNAKVPVSPEPPPRKPLQLIVKQLCYYNDCLEGHSTLLERLSLRYSLRTSLVREQNINLTLIREAADLLGHVEIQQWARTRFLIERELDKWDDDRNIGLDEYNVLWFDENYLTYNERVVDGSQLRSLATYKGRKTVVDWYYWASSYSISVDDARIQNLLAKFLCQDLGQLKLSILQFVGITQDNKGRIGYAFGLPNGAAQVESLRELHVERHQPDLENRFKLANALVRTIFGMHSLGWFHGNVSTLNVVFSPQIEGVATNLSHPYLLGFGLQGFNKNKKERYGMIIEYPGGMAESTGISKYSGGVIESDTIEYSVGDSDSGYYRHPEFRGTNRASPSGWGTSTDTFKPSYDIYSLGVVLWEIGIWKALTERWRWHLYTSSGWRTTTSKGKGSHETLTAEAITELGGQMGRRYTNAVIACLDGTFDKIWEPGLARNSQQLYDHLREFQEKIIDPLAACSV